MRSKVERIRHRPVRRFRSRSRRVQSCTHAILLHSVFDFGARNQMLTTERALSDSDVLHVGSDSSSCWDRGRGLGDDLSPVLFGTERTRRARIRSHLTDHIRTRRKPCAFRLTERPSRTCGLGHAVRIWDVSRLNRRSTVRAGGSASRLRSGTPWHFLPDGTLLGAVGPTNR